MYIPKEIQNLIQGKRESLTAYKSGAGTRALLASEILQRDKNVIVVLPNQQALDLFWSLIQPITGEDEHYKPFWERTWHYLPSFAPGGKDRSQWAQRWATLFALSQGQRAKGIALSIDNFLPFWPRPEVIEREYLLLLKDTESRPEEIVEKAVQWGYERVSMVTRTGELAVRGDILDIFAPGYPRPLRLEFFGDMVESLRLFEPLSQRSMEDVSEAVLLPVSPMIKGENYIQDAKKHWEHLWKTGELDKRAKGFLELVTQEEDIIPWPGLFYRQVTSLDKWFPDEAVYFLAEGSFLRSRLEETNSKWLEFLDQEEAHLDWRWPQKNLIQSVNMARQAWLGKPHILFEELPLGEQKDGLELLEERYQNYEQLFWQPEQRRRPWRALLSALQEWQQTSRQVILLFHTQNSRKKFLYLVEEEGWSINTEYNLEKKGIFALISDYSKGLKLVWNQVFILAEDVLQPKQESKSSKRSSKSDFVGLRQFEDLQPGELLVHRDYGLGQFAGLTRLQVERTGNDYLLLQYADNDKLYVPVDRLNLVQRYKGPEGASPALDKLGGSRWKNTKSRVRKAIEKIAHDLVEMYAFRKVSKGFEYSPSDGLYREFEASFGFEETADQEQAIKAVLEDMHGQEPMDRLVCGDVGFGKTEVAMRAAFRAVEDGKQAALLCPTTVLAEQHFQNFRRRMEEFSVRVEMLSRFVSSARQKQILKSVQQGEVDILIGTHRLLSKDVYIPRLTLLILDEEQRFGVKHKERLKQLRKNVDVLTLTATPIPRTLQLSLSGIRQLSIIETPPQERKAVQTSLIERDPEMLRWVLSRELEREGQVFWVHNRVQGLQEVKGFVQRLAPNARVAMAHGQMAERALEEAMHDFWQGKIDILVCTAIIESGLDFPRANTLIVDQAQRFGLGQLYQLRGRVGRAKRQAYACFVVPSLGALSGNAKKRLQTILELDYLGAGFRVAMEDLRLRGAGNILGEVQSGNIGKVGLDLFLEMLEQEVSRQRGEPLKQDTDPELNISFAANIPEDYMADPQERLYYYKRLSSEKDQAGLDQLADEIRDRYGAFPGALNNFLEILRLKQLLARLQVVRADLLQNRIVLTWSEDTQAVQPQQLVAWMQAHQDRAKFLPPAKLELRLQEKTSTAESIRLATEELASLPRADSEKQIASQSG